MNIVMNRLKTKNYIISISSLFLYVVFFFFNMTIKKLIVIIVRNILHNCQILRTMKKHKSYVKNYIFLIIKIFKFITKIMLLLKRYPIESTEKDESLSF